MTFPTQPLHVVDIGFNVTFVVMCFWLAGNMARRTKFGARESSKLYCLPYSVTGIHFIPLFTSIPSLPYSGQLSSTLAFFWRKAVIVFRVLDLYFISVFGRPLPHIGSLFIFIPHRFILPHNRGAMKRLLVLLAFLAPMVCHATAPAYVQSCSGGTSSNTANCTLTGVGAGHLLVIYTRVNVGNATVGFTGDTVVTDASCFNWPNGFSSNTMQISWVVSATGGNETITATWSGSNFNFLVVAEYSGAAASPFDGCHFVNVNANPVNSGNITTTAADDLLIGTFTDASGSTAITSVSASYTSRQMANSGSTIFDEFWDNTSLKAAGATSFQVNFSATQSASVEIAGFKSASPTIPATGAQIGAFIVGP